MNESQFYALMTCRRAMGDIGREVELRHDDFNALVETTRGGSMSPLTPFEARKHGQFTINTCNGPTVVRCSGFKKAERDKTEEEVTAERLKEIHSRLDSMTERANEQGKRIEALESNQQRPVLLDLAKTDFGERLAKLEKWRAEGHIINLSNRIASLENNDHGKRIQELERRLTKLIVAMRERDTLWSDI